MLQSILKIVHCRKINSLCKILIMHNYSDILKFAPKINLNFIK